jgi:membrane protease YdiL (CAAX protease family)
MTTFQKIALLLTVIWLLTVLFRFRRSRTVIIGGLIIIGTYTLFAFIFGQITPGEIGLGLPDSWLITVGIASGGLIFIIVYSPLADLLASRWFHTPPKLEPFRAIQQSRVNLIMGIVLAWLLGGILEELIARGIVLKSIDCWLTGWFIEPVAAGIAICIAASGAGVMHFYQGLRAMAIITQISVLFGILFVISGYNLWTVVLCHGLYDTIAFVRFAAKKSKYSHLERN